MKYFLFPFFSRVSESKDLLSKNYKEIEKKKKNEAARRVALRGLLLLLSPPME